MSPGFGGIFWAPDVIFLGNRYRMYYSCAGQGAPAAIGVATANNLAGPWTDQGLVVAGNNAIDPAPLIDGGNLWMTWGNWQTGIDLLQLNPSNGKPLNSSRWDLVPGQVEAPICSETVASTTCSSNEGCAARAEQHYYTVVGALEQRHGTLSRQEWRERSQRRAAACSCRIAMAATSGRGMWVLAKAVSRTTSTMATKTARRSCASPP